MITVTVTVVSILFGINALWAVFLAGVVLDLLDIAPLGSHSLFFLIILWLTVRYQRKIHVGAFLYPAIFIFLAAAAEGVIFQKHIDYLTVTLQTTIGMAAMIILSRIFPEKVKDKKRLSV